MTDTKPTTVLCRKYGRQMEALLKPPMGGEKGLELQRTVSRQAWEEWQQNQTMLINENQLNLRDRDSRAWLLQQMEAFLSGEEYARPQGYRPKTD